MKANELMIGDWVRIEEPDKYAGAKGTIYSLMHHHSDEGCYFHVFVQDLGVVMREVFNEDLRPIPLTAEILEKNGFRKDKYGYFIYKDHEEEVDVWLRNSFVEITHTKFIFNPEDVTEVDFDESLTFKKCYVHNLQHALRDFKLDKEIVL